MDNQSSFIAVVTSTTRRYVDVADIASDGKVARGKVSSAALEVTVGDLVECHRRGSEIIVEKIRDRKNILVRSLGEKTKTLGANIDLLFIVTAPHPLFNSVFVDRIIAASWSAGIECCLLANKNDLREDFAKTEESFERYRRIGIRVIEISAKLGDGVETIEELLDDENLDLVAFAGVSGVGKTTLLRALLPQLTARTREVSEKTGQGKQTTSLSIAHIRMRSCGKIQFLVDLPGIQNFGISHLSAAQVRNSFPEINAVGESCRFANCEHREEPECMVRKGLEEGLISQTRYTSFINMMDEIKNARKYG